MHPGPGPQTKALDATAHYGEILGLFLSHGAWSFVNGWNEFADATFLLPMSQSRLPVSRSCTICQGYAHRCTGLRISAVCICVWFMHIHGDITTHVKSNKHRIVLFTRFRSLLAYWKGDMLMSMLPANSVVAKSKDVLPLPLLPSLLRSGFLASSSVISK